MMHETTMPKPHTHLAGSSRAHWPTPMGAQLVKLNNWNDTNYPSPHNDLIDFGKSVGDAVATRAKSMELLDVDWFQRVRCLFWVMCMVWQGGSAAGGTKIPMSCVEGIVLERGLREALGSFQIHEISISVYGLGMWFRGSFFRQNLHNTNWIPWVCVVGPTVHSESGQLSAGWLVSCLLAVSRMAS